MSRGYRSSPYLAIRLGGTGDVSGSHVVWKTPTGAPYVSSLVFYDGLLYMATEMGIVTAIDAATGQQVWRERIGGVFTASPVAGDGKIYLVSETRRDSGPARGPEAGGHRAQHARRASGGVAGDLARTTVPAW